jgi:hypothetical protein
VGHNGNEPYGFHEGQEISTSAERLLVFKKESIPWSWLLIMKYFDLY